MGRATAWLTSVLVALVCYDVFTRYWLNQSSVAVQEMEWHLFALIFLLAAAYTLRHDKHVRVDLIYANLTPQQKAWIDVIGGILFLIPFCLMIIVSSQEFVLNAFRVRETSPDPGGLPGRYLLKAVIPLGFTLLLLQGLATTCTALLTALGKNPSDGETQS